MKKNLIIVYLFLFLNIICFAHNNESHDEFFKMVLFDSSAKLDAKEQDKLLLLNYASRVAIDQYNGSYEAELNYLKSKGIKTITSLEEIDYTGNAHHQRYTHRGWTFSYVSSTGNWPLRKQLILDTTNYVFFFPSKDQQDAFSALMYYIHILGDHDGDEISNSMDRIALGGRADKLDIIDELSNIYLPKLFKFQKSEVSLLAEKLQKVNNKCDKLIRRKDENHVMRRDVNELSDEEYKTYQKYAKETFNILFEDVPKLLKNEKWFIKAFPSAK